MKSSPFIARKPLPRVSIHRSLFQLFGLRERYVLTRARRLRARYIVGMVVAGIIMLNVAVTNLSLFTARPHAQIAAADYVDTNRQGQNKFLAQAATSKSFVTPTAASATGAELQAAVATEAESINANPVTLALATLKAPPVPMAKPIKTTSTPTGPVVTTLNVSKGKTLAETLQKAGLSREESNNVIAKLEPLFDVRKIRPDHNIAVQLNPTPFGMGGGLQLASLSLQVDNLKSVEINRNPQGELQGQSKEKKVSRQMAAGRAVIKNSVYGAAKQAGIPESIVSNAIKLYGMNVDFQREVQEGDTMEVLYERDVTEDGQVVGSGNILYAKLILSGTEMPIYMHVLKDGSEEYFTADGKGIRRSLLKTPIDGARMTSGFGMRRHPVLGYSKMHTGIDFGAPKGTPVFAAGDGVVERASWFSSYGNYIKVRHSGDMRTAYAHLSGYAKGVKPGSRVKQGQVIGYVGTTGRSTGPHLHYEVLVSGKAINPNKLNLPAASVLKGEELRRFQNRMRTFHQEFASLLGSMKVAALETIQNTSSVR
ncbi:MAG: peptidoglycan DD-metalloendopeptidase family protein [Alphaproteobacteria bacterium]|nr:peptidoglycan DD-metalloendopeptidase family protein [Alphaproteobacteria bacterium]